MITLHPFVEAHPDAVFIWHSRIRILSAGPMENAHEYG